MDKIQTITLSGNVTKEVTVAPPNGRVTVSIMNFTSGDLNVSLTSDFEESGDTKKYLVIPSDCYYNSLSFYGDSLYLKASSDGTVTVIREDI